jgi:hypothetical protein
MLPPRGRDGKRRWLVESPLMDVLVEMDGGWKFMSFRADT